jgi:hypothetical protein
MCELVDDFEKRTKQINKADYGDFMRTENIYLNHLMQKLQILGDEELNRKLVAMQTYLQFAPNWDVESTRDRLLEDLQIISELLEGHLQDWESAIPLSG